MLAGGELDELDVMDVLDQLVDKSLVVADEQDEGGVRYRLLESIRQYGAERLEAEGDTAAVRRRHADHYVAVAEAAGPHLRNRDQVEWSRSVLHDVDNFRAVLEWAVETSSPDQALRLVAAFSVTGMAIGDVAVDWAETATLMDGAGEHPLFPTVAGFASLGATFAGELDRAQARADVALAAQARLGTPTSSVERALSLLMLYQGDFGLAQVHAQAWVDLARASDDRCDLADALVMLNGALFDEPERAWPIAEEAIQVARDAGILSALSFALAQLAGYLPIEESARALALLDEAADASAQIGNDLALSTAMVTRSLIALRCGEWPTALAAALQLARRQIEFGQAVSFFSSLDSALIALWGLDRSEAAAVLLGKSRTLEGRVHPDWMTALLAEVEAFLRQTLGASRFAELTAQGATLDNADAVAYVAAEAAEVLASD